jgi:hypothetical protein
MNNLFEKFPDSYIDNSKRIIQTPSSIARSAFFYVQETGYLKLKESHRKRFLWNKEKQKICPKAHTTGIARRKRSFSHRCIVTQMWVTPIRKNSKERG